MKPYYICPPEDLCSQVMFFFILCCCCTAFQSKVLTCSLILRTFEDILELHQQRLENIESKNIFCPFKPSEKMHKINQDGTQPSPEARVQGPSQFLHQGQRWNR